MVHGVRAENCVLASVCGRLLYWRVILSCCEWSTIGKKLSKDDDNLFARRSCTNVTFGVYGFRALILMVVRLCVLPMDVSL